MVVATSTPILKPVGQAPTAPLEVVDLLRVQLTRLVSVALAIAAFPAMASGQVIERQSAEDAWWTGPMLANSAATLPTGHALVETYAFDQIQKGSSFYGSLTYLLYGVTDRFTVGAKPLFGVARSEGRTSRPGMGDLTLSAQYRLTDPKAVPGTPTIAVSLQQSLPTGRHDRLTDYRGTALGTGSGTTTLSLYGQQLFWLPNGRIFRGRINLSGAWAGKATVSGASVYGTDRSFKGQARPGAIYSVGVSGEYSLTREWVLALDLVLTHSRSTRVSGQVLDDISQLETRVAYRLPATSSLAIAPAIEYSWRPDLGVLLGARVIPGWGHTPASLTPAVAVNYVH